MGMCLLEHFWNGASIMNISLFGTYFYEWVYIGALLLLLLLVVVVVAALQCIYNGSLYLFLLSNRFPLSPKYGKVFRVCVGVGSGFAGLSEQLLFCLCTLYVFQYFKWIG